MIRKLSVFLFFISQFISAIQSNNGLRNFSVNDGLTHTSICGVVQDLDGFIWVGTLNGLCRYDGTSILDLKNSKLLTYQIPDNRLNRIYLDSQNRIWLAAKETSISYFNPRTNAVKKLNLKLDPYDFIVSFLEDKNNNIWFVTKSGLLGKVYVEEAFMQYKFYQFPKDVVVKNIAVLEEKVFVVSDKGTLYSSSIQGGEFLPTVSKSICNNIFNVKNIGIVAEFKNSLKVLEIIEGKLTFKNLIDKTFYNATKIVADKNQNIYIANLKGEVLVYKPSKDSSYSNSKIILNKGGRSFKKIEDLFIDKAMGLWISTGSKGVYLYDTYSKPFTLFNKLNSDFPSNHITAIAELNDDLWVGTKKGLSVLGTGIHPKIDSPISDIFQDSDHNIWVGTKKDGIYIIREGLIFKHLNRNNKFVSDKIASFAEDKYGRVWVGTYDKGVFAVEKSDIKNGVINFKKITTSTNFVINIYADPLYENTMWIGSNNKGLLKIELVSKDKTILSTYSYDKNNNRSLSSNLVKPILRDSSGDLWIGTLGKGMNKLHDEKGKVWFERILKEGTIANYNVASIQEDNQGFLWLGGEGLAKYDKASKKFLVYGYKDGLQSNAFKVGADFKAEDGKLYFGGVDGFNAFYPSAIVPNPHGPELIFVDLEVNRKSIKIGEYYNDRQILKESLNSQKEFTLNYDENDFSINLMATSFINPTNNKIVYKLEGRDKSWVRISKSKRSLQFSNLEYGTYILRAKAANIDGVWGEENSLKIKVLPPWWKTIWAYSSYVFLILSGLFVIISIVKKRQENKLNYLTSQKDIEMKNSKIELFTNIAHEIRTPLTLVYSPLKEFIEGGMQIENAFGKIEMMYLNAKKILKLTNGILDYSKIESGTTDLNIQQYDFVKLIKEVNAFFVIGMSEKQIEFNFTSALDSCITEFDIDKMEAVISNLLSNCLKYTEEGGKVKVSLDVVGTTDSNAEYSNSKDGVKLTNNYIKLVFQDNGIGISQSALSSIFERYYRAENSTRVGTGIGLSLVKSIIDLHRGEILYQSSRGEGTICTVKIPVVKKINKAVKDVEEITVKKVDSNIKSLDVFKDKTILLVEDNLSLMNYISDHLEGYANVLKASNGKMGLQLAKENIPDIIISDVMMPEMNGVEMLQQIKNDENISFIPVILLTARTFAQYELEGIDMGAHDYVTKPFDINLLVGKLKNILYSNQKFKEFYNNSDTETKEILSSINNKNQEFINKLKKIVEANFLNEDFTVQTLSREVFMSNSACYKRVKSLTGDSLVKFIRDVRLERAAYLLKQDELSITEIARNVGINDLKYFRTKFSSKYGLSPKQYALEFKNNNHIK